MALNPSTPLYIYNITNDTPRGFTPNKAINDHSVSLHKV